MINESLRPNDLRHFIKKVFEIDSFKSKIGNDSDVIVLSFTVDGEDPAKDLENFIEMGYDFVIDADVSTGESDDGTYKVFVELERTRYSPEQIRELLDGIQKLANLETMRFRYFKSFKSQEATLENLEATVPLDKQSYEEATDRNSMNNFSNFFSNSYADELNVVDESISFKRPFSGRVTFNILDSGNKTELYESIRGPIMMENKDMAEVMFLTKIIGNYNITKINNTFIFERNGYAIALERK